MCGSHRCVCQDYDSDADGAPLFHNTSYHHYVRGIRLPFQGGHCNHIINSLEVDMHPMTAACTDANDEWMGGIAKSGWMDG